MKKNIGIIGCGNMAYALLKGLLALNKKDYASIYVYDINFAKAELFAKDFAVLACEQGELIKKSEIVILAVKPQQIKNLLIALQDEWQEKHLLVSLAAGVSTADIENLLPSKVPVIRVMTNTPALVQEGMSTISAGRYAGAKDIETVEKMMLSIGKVVYLDESYKDAITVVAGGGPAYLFLMVEAMLDAAIGIGLNKDLAEELIVQTLKGSVKILENRTEHPSVLRQEVSSPAGITIEAIKQLEEYGFRSAFFNAFDAAYKRTKELGLD